MGPVTILNHRNELLPRAPRLLIVEQDAAHAERVLRELQEAGIQSFPSIVENTAELAAALHSGEFDLALLDCTLRNGDCPEEVEMLRLTRNKTPFVLLTELPEEAAAAQCIKFGASDYILKERLTRLPFAVKRALHQHELLQESTRTRAALKESEMRVRDLIENAAFGTFRAGVDGRFQSANEAILKILAYTDYAELQALRLASDVFRYAEAFLLILNDCRGSGMVRNVETEWRRRDGAFVCVRLHLQYVDNGGADDSIEGIVEDVTELRALERQLQQAQKFETIGQLAGGIAHDFNNVLGAVIGWASSRI